MPKPFRTEVPACTSDFYPTLLDLLKIKVPGQVEPIDGISLLPLIDGKMSSRPKPIAFEMRNPKTAEPTAAALVDNQYKFIRMPPGAKQGPGRRGPQPPIEALYDLAKTPEEEHDLSHEMPDIAARMKQRLGEWEASVEKSLREYPVESSGPDSR